MIAATNKPEVLDEAALRRFPNRFYVPMPDSRTRRHIIKTALKKHVTYDMSRDDFMAIAEQTKGYSGSDLWNLCREAAMVPIRPLDLTLHTHDSLPPVKLGHFERALKKVRKTVMEEQLDKLEEWNKEYGMARDQEDHMEGSQESAESGGEEEEEDGNDDRSIWSVSSSYLF